MLFKIGANTLAASAGRVIGSILALISVALMTRGLGVVGFGEYAIIIAYLTTFQILADGGLYSLFTKELGQNPHKDRELLGTYLTLRLLAGAFLFVLACGLIFLFPYSDAVKVGTILASSGFLAVSLTQIFMGVFQARMVVYRAAAAEVVGRGVQLALVALFFSQGGGLNEFILANLAASFAILFINLFFITQLVPVRLSFSRREAARVSKIAAPIALSIVFTLLYFKADTLMLSVLKGPAEVGLYGAAYRVLETFIFFPAVLIGLFLPILSRQALKDSRAFSRSVSTLAEVLGAIVAPLAAGGILLSATLLSLIGGQEFTEAAPALAVLFGAVAMIFWGTLFGNAVVASGLQKKALLVYAAGFLFNFSANLIAIPQYSYLGAAWTTVITEALVTILLAFIVAKAYPLQFSKMIILGVIVATSTMVLGVEFVFHPFGRVVSVVEGVLIISFGAGVYALSCSPFLFLLWKKLKGLEAGTK